MKVLKVLATPFLWLTKKIIVPLMGKIEKKESISIGAREEFVFKPNRLFITIFLSLTVWAFVMRLKGDGSISDTLLLGLIVKSSALIGWTTWRDNKKTELSNSSDS
jgi:hypothetical protein